ncbi:sulfite exporter TauE/SafE family protein [Robiginitalea sp. M366]|uniref:sulfite exporter TauE/SafE family protein n=1 Tax=Robiginitalea aestuariiviva TaxID=3036903 RepID=UPI00240D9F83|nr:sulfite exporter TauE/SafE family protein [Robiginitalea aestuariiviva]MDG1571120.1 sulfite exporter TauE/SafE family protein [Robiginitalea aestuariiviva]
MIATAFILGLMGSLHCIGMCGPIAFMLPLDRERPVARYAQLGLYHVGRLLAYGAIGLIFGLVGRGLYLFGFQQYLSIGVGLIMILSVVVPSHWFSRWQLTRPAYRLVGRLRNALGNQLKQRGPDTFLTLGLLNGLLPCGLVYMALIGAMALASAPEGAAYMMLFGAGTIPLMSAAALLGKLLKGRWAPLLRRTIPVLVVLIGALFILRGLGLGIPYLSPPPPGQHLSAAAACHP